MHRQFLRPVMVHEVWEVAARAASALEQNAAGADRCAGCPAVPEQQGQQCQRASSWCQRVVTPLCLSQL